jgi:hypothetical protein
MATKRQTTFAKMDRERAVREKRARLKAPSIIDALPLSLELAEEPE